VISRGWRRLVLIGLGATAGAVFPLQSHAQLPVSRDTIRGRRDTLPTPVDSARAKQVHPPAGRDTIRVPTPIGADSMIKNDSLRLGIVPLPAPPKKDSIKAPLSRAEAPPSLEIGPARIYDRAAMFATGALTLSDMLARIPGLTEFTTGWLDAASAVASEGDLRRIRVFLDGIELDPLDRRSQGLAAVSDLPLHALEEVRIERGADEVRVYARSWRVDRTTPYTRADIATGDQNTNLYRAYFGRRYDHGEALQISAEQNSTQPDRRLPSTSGLHIMGRFGTTHGPWSGDLFAERSDVDRGKWTGNGNFLETLDTIPGWETRRTTAYARVGNGDPEVGRWIQLVAAVEGFRGSPHIPSTLATVGLPSEVANQVPDSTAYENQYLLTGGATLLGAQLSAAERLRVSEGRTSHVLSGRASFQWRGVAASLLGEGKSALDPSRAEATVRVTPMGRIALLGSASRTGGGRFVRIFGDFGYSPVYLGADGTLQRPPEVDSSALADPFRLTVYELAPRTNLRAEAGVRLYDVWLSAGLLQRGATTLLPAANFDTSYSRPGAMRVEGQATGRTLAARGHLYKALNVDAWAVAWTDSTGLYRPQYQTRSELYLQTSLLDHFPRGNFGLFSSLVHEYRSSSRFALADGSVRTAPGFRTLSFRIEIRIQSAVISYQFRNLLQEKYAEVPGYNFPRQTQFYGVRWDFWN
jgi:hypothetical protein